MQNDMNRKKIDRIFVVFLAFCGLYIIHNILFLRLDNSFSCLEQSLNSCVRNYYFICDNPVLLLKPVSLSRLFGPLAPDRAIYEVFTWPFFCLFGVSRDTAIYPNFIFLIVLIFSVYKIGIMVKDRYAGMLAVFYMLLCPAAFGYLRIYFTPIATSAFVSLGAYALFSSDSFKDLKKAMLWAFSCIMLLKLKFEKPAVFLLIPTLIYLFQSFVSNRRDPAHLRIYFRNIFIAAAAFLFLFFLFFGIDSLDMRIKYYLNGVKEASHVIMVSQDRIGFGALFVYFKGLFTSQLSTLGLLLFAAALPFSLRSRIKYKAVIFSWFFFPYAFHLLYYYFSGIRSPYYTASCLPAIALITSCGIQKILSLLRRRARVVLSIACVILLMANYVYLSHFARWFSPGWEAVYTSLSGDISLVRISPYKEIIEETQRLIDIIIAAKGRAEVVFVNHYPSLHTVYGLTKTQNTIRRNRVSIYDFSLKLFNIEPADSKAFVMKKLARADLVIDGNRFYPVESSSVLKKYKQFGTRYDFSGYMRREEAAFNAVRNSLVEVRKIKARNYNATLYLSRQIYSELEKKVPRPLNFDSAQNEVDLLKYLRGLRSKTKDTPPGQGLQTNKPVHGH